MIPINVSFFLKTLLISGLFSISQAYARTGYHYDQCNDLLREGIRDDLAENSSKKYKLVKHQQFCSIAKKNNLSERNFESFAQDYAKEVKNTNSKAGGDVSFDYGILSLDADYTQTFSSNSLSEKERIALLKNHQKDILDYYKSNCGDSSYEEQLEMEANLTTRIASSLVVESWKECMVKKHGCFAYPIFNDEDLLLFSIRVEYKDSGFRHICSLSLEWFGDNVSSHDFHISKSKKGRKTENLLSPPDKVLLNGASLEIPLSRENNKQNDVIWIHTITGDGILNSFSFKLPKKVEIQNINPIAGIPAKPEKQKAYTCKHHQKKALKMRAITPKEYEDYVDLNIAPIPVLADSWSILHPITCEELDRLAED